MKANKGDWFSLTWEITDFYDPIAFEQYEKAPRFLYAGDPTAQIEADVIQEFDHIRLVSIALTTVFIVEDNGMKFPTHYKAGEFGPGDRPKYDAWLAEYHQIIYTVSERIRDKEELQQKKIFLDHTAKIIRHDMHSGINTYLPRGIKTLLSKLPDSVVKKHKLQLSIKLLEEGIEMTQNAYRGVYAFTNLVKGDQILEMKSFNLKKGLVSFLEKKAYRDKIDISKLPTIEANEYLLCLAIDNLIRGGLQFNDSEEKWVKIFMESKDVLCIQDNGVGMSKEDFISYCKPYVRSKETGDVSLYQGLDLNIAVAIIEDHGFSIEPEKLECGTMFRINLNRSREHIIDNTTPKL
jgi:light-regulated signal transduction histidine kinase (bacteriophytochrome)